MQRSLDRFSLENPRLVGYINHQQQTTNTWLTNKFCRKTVTGKKKKKSEHLRKMQKLAGDKQNTLVTQKTSQKTAKKWNWAVAGSSPKSGQSFAETCQRR
jgi:hypothetical protein